MLQFLLISMEATEAQFFPTWIEFDPQIFSSAAQDFSLLPQERTKNLWCQLEICAHKLKICRPNSIPVETNWNAVGPNWKAVSRNSFRCKKVSLRGFRRYLPMAGSHGIGHDIKWDPVRGFREPGEWGPKQPGSKEQDAEEIKNVGPF